jgi:hypothetical protein
MNTSLNNLNNDAEKESNPERKKRRRLSKMGNPVWGVTWRVLVVCAAIDIPLWAYFHFVQGVSVWQGLAQLRSEVQTKINPPKAPEPIPFKIAGYKQGDMYRKPS